MIFSDFISKEFFIETQFVRDDFLWMRSSKNIVNPAPHRHQQLTSIASVLLRANRLMVPGRMCEILLHYCALRIRINSAVWLAKMIEIQFF